MQLRIIPVLLAFLLCPLSRVFAQAYRVGVDPRVELLSIVFHLAGNGEYTQGRVPSYTAAIDRYFAPYKNHPAVLMARELRDTDGVGFDAPMDLAVHLGDPPSLSERIPFDSPNAELGERWHGVKARRFVEALRSFVADTKFMEFLKSQQPLYDLTNERLQKFVETGMDLGWYDKFYGVHTSARLIIVPGLVNGGPSYAAGFIGSDGVREIYSIPGVWQVDAQGLPKFSGDFIQGAVHEVIHSYSNGLVDKYYGQMAKAGDELYAHVGPAMRRQAYGDGASLLYESMVRAATIRYVLAHQGPEAAQRDTENELNNSFLWIGDLSDLIGTYEQNREKYPTLESFMPNIVKFFNDVAPRGEELLRRYDESRPKVASLNIPNHSQEVDPGLKEIVITFNRPMRKAPDPQDNRDPRFIPMRFDSTGTTLSIGVALEPDRQYQFPLAWPGRSRFASAEGVPMDDYIIEFHTKPSSNMSTRQ